MREGKAAPRKLLAFIVFSILITGLPYPLLGATISLKSNDPQGFGFNDTSPRDPIGGNDGTTLGQQRINVFNYAAELWGKLIYSRVKIVIEASFKNLSCSRSSALLGAAGAARIFANFPKAPKRDVWYPSALANALEGRDISAADADIVAEFNARLDDDSECLGGLGWYYGLDHKANRSIDFLNMLMHEIAHGLGIQALLNAATGRFLGGRPGIYEYFVRDLSQDMTLPEMATDALRRNTVVNAGNVVWDGAGVTAQAWSLLNGTGPDGKVLLYAPKRFDASAAISHWDTSVWPEALMEPYLSSRLRASEKLDITVCMLEDIGWKLGTSGDCLTVEFGSPDIHVSPGVIQFGEGGIGNSHITEARVSNEGNTILSIDAVAGDEALSSPFSIHSETCSGSVLAPGNSCTINVQFSPESRGDFDDRFDIVSNDPDTPKLSVSLTGEGSKNRSSGRGGGGSGGGGCTLQQSRRCDPTLALLALLSVLFLLSRKLSANETSGLPAQSKTLQ